MEYKYYTREKDKDDYEDFPSVLLTEIGSEINHIDYIYNFDTNQYSRRYNDPYPSSVIKHIGGNDYKLLFDGMEYDVIDIKLEELHDSIIRDIYKDGIINNILNNI